MKKIPSVDSLSQIDVQRFGKVLISLGHFIQSNPQVLFDLLKTSEPNPQNSTNTGKAIPGLNLENIAKFPLFELARTSTEAELISSLSVFSIDELKHLMKINQISSTKLRNKVRVIGYIAEQAKKRTVDVFRHHR